MELKHKTPYFARFLESKASEETRPAIHDLVNEVNALGKAKAACRIHAGRAPELAGEKVREYCKEKGIRVTSTAGYDPNNNRKRIRATRCGETVPGCR